MADADNVIRQLEKVILARSFSPEFFDDFFGRRIHKAFDEFREKKMEIVRSALIDDDICIMQQRPHSLEESFAGVQIKYPLVLEVEGLHGLIDGDYLVTEIVRHYGFQKSGSNPPCIAAKMKLECFGSLQFLPQYGNASVTCDRLSIITEDHHADTEKPARTPGRFQSCIARLVHEDKHKAPTVPDRARAVKSKTTTNDGRRFLMPWILDKLPQQFSRMTMHG